MTALIINIGDELLSGLITNTNAAFIAEKILEVGIETRKILVINDSETEIYNSIKRNYDLYNLIIITGGLGPTHDDVTKSALCRYFDSHLVVNEQVKENIKRIFTARNLEWVQAAEEQSLVPDKCKVIPNKNGTAAGMIFENKGNYLIALPGVPYEMETMMDEHVVPMLKNLSKESVVVQKTLRTTGIPEANLSELLGNINEFTGICKLAFLPSPLGVNLRLTATGVDKISAVKQLEKFVEVIKSRAGGYIYGVDNGDLSEIIGRLLIESKLTLSVAESCTGGLICSRITDISGSSKYFERGIVAYSNESKTKHLNVHDELLKKYGAVSKEVAEAMAVGIRVLANTDIGISTTGIAGPTGGTADKPVGLVWIGYSDTNHTFSEKFYFGEDRKRIKIRASQTALDLLRKELIKISKR